MGNRMYCRSLRYSTMRSGPDTPMVPPTPAPTSHLQGRMLISPFPLAVTTLFSFRYFRIDVVPAVEMSCVLSAPYCVGGMRMRLGITAKPLADHEDCSAAFTSARISAGVFDDHSGEAAAPFGTLVTFVTKPELTRPVCTSVESPVYACSSMSIWCFSCSAASFCSSSGRPVFAADSSSNTVKRSSRPHGVKGLGVFALSTDTPLIWSVFFPIHALPVRMPWPVPSMPALPKFVTVKDEN